MKRKNPYQMLLDRIIKFCGEVRHRHTRTMFVYPKDRLAEGWSLSDLYQRAAAAEQLGYDVVVSAEAQGLMVRYVKKPPTVPFEWQKD